MIHNKTSSHHLSGVPFLTPSKHPGQPRGHKYPLNNISLTPLNTFQSEDKQRRHVSHEFLKFRLINVLIYKSATYFCDATITRKKLRLVPTRALTVCPGLTWKGGNEKGKCDMSARQEDSSLFISSVESGQEVLAHDMVSQTIYQKGQRLQTQTGANFFSLSPISIIKHLVDVRQLSCHRETGKVIS